MKTLHPKIQELRSKYGHIPVHLFNPNPSKFEQRSKALNLRSVREKKDGERLIQQYFCIWGVPDDRGTVPMKGCWKKSIEERGPKSSANNKIIVLNQHDQKDPLCLPIVLEEDEVGLYAEYEPDPIPSGDRLIVQIRRGTINGGSYGFNYVWDKMEYVEDTGLILMHEITGFEISPVTLPSQMETFVVRNSSGIAVDEFLEEDTEALIKLLPRNKQLEARQLIQRHISLAKAEPLEVNPNTLGKDKPKQRSKELTDYLTKNLFNKK